MTAEMKTQLFLCATGPHRVMAKTASKRWLKCLPELAGVTIAGDADAKLCGLGHHDSIRQACGLKLFAWDLVPEDVDAILYADLDIYPYQPMAPSVALADVDFACVRDRWDDHAISEVADPLALPRHQYFNAGLFYARRAAEPMMRAARLYFDRLKWYDQTGLNVARFVHQTRTAWLPWHANAMDLHRAGYHMSAAHCPDIAWPAWNQGADQSTPAPLPDAEAFIGSLDLSHPFSTSAEHLRVLAGLAKGRRHILEVGTFQGAAAWSMASSGALVTTLDPAHLKSSRMFHQRMSLDAMAHTGAQWLAMDPDGLYDMIFHDAEHGPHIVPELEQWWQRLLPGGVLAIHDAEQLEGWNGQTLTPEPSMISANADTRGRELLVIHKPSTLTQGSPYA